jgi:methylenetetrahydrofolate dehydrogenase (NADP+) / methenyltetrahydrofolate cyclohydrolase
LELICFLESDFCDLGMSALVLPYKTSYNNPMHIDGRIIAERIYTGLTVRIIELRKQGIIPKLAVVLIGDDPGSVNYVSQKEKHAKKIGADLIIERLATDISQEALGKIVHEFNMELKIHGIIIQRPAPTHISKEFLNEAVIPEKDVDGFHPNSDFAAPIALAVERILYEVYKEIIESNVTRESPLSGYSVPAVSYGSFADWLLGRHMVVVGRGLTAGTPIINHFHNRNTQVSVIDSQTEEPEEILGNADIVISAVGKQNVLATGALKRDAILIGVGLHTEDGVLKGDYQEADVIDRVQFYTRTPGGVGPVNVAMLMDNLVRAAEDQSGTVF